MSLIRSLFTFIAVMVSILLIDHLLVLFLNKNIKDRNFDVSIHLDVDQIDWTNDDWQYCWETRELLIYSFSGCISNLNYPDPSLRGEQFKVYKVTLPTSIHQHFKRELKMDFSPLGTSGHDEIFYIFQDGRVERLTGKMRIVQGGVIRERE